MVSSPYKVKIKKEKVWFVFSAKSRYLHIVIILFNSYFFLFTSKLYIVNCTYLYIYYNKVRGKPHRDNQLEEVVGIQHLGWVTALLVNKR